MGGRGAAAAGEFDADDAVDMRAGAVRCAATRAVRVAARDARERGRCATVRATGRPGRMHVPSDAFQGRSPEIAACDALKRLFTAVAARAVLAEELEQAEREGTAPSETYETLKAYMDENPIRDGNAWMQELMSRDDLTSRTLVLRLLEVRKTYADEVFNFDEMRETVMSEVSSENDRLMADYVKRMLPGVGESKED